MDIVRTAIEQMRLDIRSFDILQQKDGVTVARVFCKGGTYILKAFDRLDFCREIDNYRLLESLGIPTLEVIAAVDNALLLEDILHDGRYRLGIKEDMDSPAVARLLVRWYSQLHQKGRTYLEANPDCGFYDENDALTRENIEKIKEKTDTGALPVWKRIEDNFDRIRACLDGLTRTLTYNDFYYTNLAVAKDGNFALMFDYNLLGKGYVYADISNVCASLSEQAAAVFREEYGACEPLEKAMYDATSPLLALQSAFQRNIFLSWAKASLEELKRKDYLYKVEKLLSLL